MYPIHELVEKLGGSIIARDAASGTYDFILGSEEAAAVARDAAMTMCSGVWSTRVWRTEGHFGPAWRFWGTRIRFGRPGL